jgi:hypothetical protein
MIIENYEKARPMTRTVGTIPIGTVFTGEIDGKASTYLKAAGSFKITGVPTSRFVVDLPIPRVVLCEMSTPVYECQLMESRLVLERKD